VITGRLKIVTLGRAVTAGAFAGNGSGTLA
jgi:hypothetical protein